MQTISKIINIAICILVIGWFGIIAYDYYMVVNKEWPAFCFKEGKNVYEDIDVEWCSGAGYKAYKVHRNGSLYEFRFGPFWMQEPS